MKNQNKTRFEVGNKAVAIINGHFVSMNIIGYEEDSVRPILASTPSNERFYYTNEGYGLHFGENPAKLLFTLPEYEAFKALTDSFVDGTFGKEVQLSTIQPNFEPIVNEPVISNGERYIVSHIEDSIRYSGVDNEKGIYFKNVRLENIKPVEGYQYANGFCIPLTELEQPEITDLIENGQPVYFKIGQEVGCIHRQMKGKVMVINTQFTYPVLVEFDNENKTSYTLDGRMHDTVAQTLYPIEQYNQIQLPKLKPIQVKPKADVISLPSWFKGGVVIPMYSISEYLTKNTSKDIKDKLNEFILIANGNKYAEVEFYEMTKRVIEHEPPIRAIKFAFVCKSMYFGGYLDLDSGQNSYLARMYELNANSIEEVLTDENTWHICE